jgi:ribonuclease G
MNKELFVSSTPHETKVGMVEDDLLAEIYLERENEYTLAGSIYKGRVTRVLPGMQSAFVDIGLERDAFLYVSDFMELEEHDDDLTESIPANRSVPDLRAPAPAQGVAEHPIQVGSETVAFDAEAGEDFNAAEGNEAQPISSASPLENSGGRDRDQDRGGYRGRRRRRGGRRDGRDNRDRASEPRMAASVIETVPAPVQPMPHFSEPRPSEIRSSEPRFSETRFEPRRPQGFGPPAAYQPIILPGESISKYRGVAPAAPPAAAPVSRPEPAVQTTAEVRSEPAAPLAATFPEDEPIFAAPAAVAAEQTDRSAHFVPADDEEVRPASAHARSEEPLDSASTSVDWNREFRRRDSAAAAAVAPAADEEVRDEVEEEQDAEDTERAMLDVAEETPAPSYAQATGSSTSQAFEEETIDDEEADTVRYEAASDEGFDEFEEETRDAGTRVFSEVRETVAEIHMTSLADSGIAPAAAPETEEDSEELELEEAQAQAEAMLDAEAGGNGTVDARVEVRAPATAGYTQRAPRPRPDRQGDRPGHDRPGYDRRGGNRRPGARRFQRREQQEVPKISDLLKEGQEILVQIAKEPIGKKGARITSHIALPGRFLVYMPTVNHTGVSRKIASDEERMRLKRIVMSERDNGHGGFIVRTAAASAAEEELRADIRFLKGLWNDIKTRAEASKPPALIYHDLNVVERVLRDQVTSDFSVIWVDTEPEYERILRFFNRFQPALVKRVKLYTKETPLFEQFGLKDEMDKALKSKVWLKSGGYIVINQTEALVAIDINTGKYVGKTSRLEDTIVKTNVDAIKEIVRQIRLRDLGGIIIIDFIDMDERRNRQRVMQALEEELRHDRAPSKVLQFNDFGLVAITRKRVKQSLERTIGAPCPYCQSTGYVKSLTTVANEIYVEMRKMAKHLEQQDVMLRVHPDIAKELKGNNGRLLNEMEELTKRTIIVKSDPALHQEQFDIN